MILLMMSLLSHTTLASLPRTRYLSPCTNDQSPAIFAMCTIRLCKSASRREALRDVTRVSEWSFYWGRQKVGLETFRMPYELFRSYVSKYGGAGKEIA